jgi:uncharacterized protein (DUF305 family)
MKRLIFCLALMMPIAAHAENTANEAFMDAHHKMMMAMDIDPTGDTDKDFAAMMIPHHKGAVDMAKVELLYGKDPELRDLAKNIIESQEKEITFMKKWLAAH